ncbi:hypothetical protein VFMJ11_A0436 [Aliivibrio fischeri MJ11]|uniref:Uncharacterized protein n=1 Tax=Aliivibrio fischeri (strain MJ11) TaxID=388396 RepID=B5ETH3_ALIFM|nr:hypothetical protein VFMJ11_A0436 [Aliivibrio fischeri MJ11]
MYSFIGNSMDSDWSDKLLVVSWVFAWALIVYFVPFAG